MANTHCTMALLPCCLFLLFQVGQAKKGGVTNVHVTFGDLEPCVKPPFGTCADFTVAEAKVTASLAGFTTGSLTTSSINYYADWWINNVGNDTSVAADFCKNGDGANQKSTYQNYSGVTYTSGSGEWTMRTASTPAADCENYCSAAGGVTPAFMGTKFDSSYTQTFSLTPSSKRRADISNSVGYAVDGVVIFSPFTGIGTVAAYDETLDTCFGHPANGLYHYHGFSPCIRGESGNQTGTSIPHSEIYGWAFDGFPIYGPYGYADGNDASSTVVRVTGGYTCTNNGTACTTDAQKAVPTNWAYAAGNGTNMLDDCNGRWTKTPEFPSGMYVYVLNIQASGSPDFPGVPYCFQSAIGIDTTTNAPTTTTTVQTTTSAPTSCGSVVGSNWNNKRCSSNCGDAGECSLTPMLKKKCKQMCNEACGCNSRRLGANILI